MLTWPIFVAGFRRGLRVYRKLFVIMAPAYVAVVIISNSPVGAVIAGWLEPLTRILNLPGESALAMVLGFGVNIYPAMGAIAALKMTTYQVTVISVLLGTAHALVIESAVLGRMGARLKYFIPYRVIIAIILAWVVSVIWMGRL
jgi:hypothetical protein